MPGQMLEVTYLRGDNTYITDVWLSDSVFDKYRNGTNDQIAAGLLSILNTHDMMGEFDDDNDEAISEVLLWHEIDTKPE
jgi:hypothetical protein